MCAQNMNNMVKIKLIRKMQRGSIIRINILLRKSPKLLITNIRLCTYWKKRDSLSISSLSDRFFTKTLSKISPFEFRRQKTIKS